MSPRPTEEPLERRAIISGIGQSAVGRRLGRPAIDLTVESALAAIEDAGLRREDIDGITTYPGGDSLTSFGYAGPPASAVIDALRLQPNWFQGSAELPGQLSAIVAAMMAVSAGLSRHVLVYRTVTESTAQRGSGRAAVYDPDGEAPPNVMGWSRVFGAPSASNWPRRICRAAARDDRSASAASDPQAADTIGWSPRYRSSGK